MVISLISKRYPLTTENFISHLEKFPKMCLITCSASMLIVRIYVMPILLQQC